MKTILFLLITGAGILFSSHPGHTEILMGTVLSVDLEKQTFVLQVKPDNDQQQEISIKAAGPLPACTRIGITMRIWGTFESEGKTFTATDIRGPGHDPTGVRARLHRFKSIRGQRSSRRSRRSGHRHGR